jgi:hypothetical protein
MSISSAGAAEPGGTMGAYALPPLPHTLFSKVEKVPFFCAKVPHLKNERSISWMNAPFAGKKVPFSQ